MKKLITYYKYRHVYTCTHTHTHNAEQSMYLSLYLDVDSKHEVILKKTSPKKIGTREMCMLCMCIKF